MPVMCVYRGLNVTPEAYDRVREAVGWEANPPAGAISHTISFGDDGAFEVNLWEDRAAYEAYSNDRLRPVLGQFGLDIGDPEIHEVYVTAVGPPADAYRVPAAVTPATGLQPA